MEKTKKQKVQSFPGVPEGVKWEIKDRLYTMTGVRKPLVFSILSKHSAKRPLLWFDEEQGLSLIHI